MAKSNYKISHLGFATLGHVLAFLQSKNNHEQIKPLIGMPVTDPTGFDQWKVAVNGYGTAGIEATSPIDNKTLLIRMITEVVPLMSKQLPVLTLEDIRKPWELVKADWEAVTSIGSAAHGVVPCFSSQSQQQYWDDDGSPTDIQGLMHKMYVKLFGHGHNGPRYNGVDTNSRHDVHVAYALANGYDVPEAVISECLLDPANAGIRSRMDLSWLPMVLRHEFTRGKLTPDHLRQIANYLYQPECRIGDLTPESFSLVEQVLNRVDGNSTIDVDNALYKAGLLVVRPIPTLSGKLDLGRPVNELAKALHEALSTLLAKNQAENAHKRHSEKQCSDRELQYDLALAALSKDSYAYSWPNRIANAVMGKDIEALLAILDAPGNETTKKVLDQMLGLKLMGVSAASRRKAIFAFCGHDTPEKCREAELSLVTIAETRKAAKNQADAPQRLARLRANAACAKFTFNGVATNGADLVDQLVAAGFDTIRAKTKGAAMQYQLVNLETQRAVALRKSNGTYAYATAKLEANAVSA